METINKLTNTNAKEFFFAGKAIVTLRNATTGNRFTYKITKSKGNKEVFFVNVFTGTDNTTMYAYTFVGTIFNRSEFRHSPKSSMPSNTKPVAVINAFVGFLNHNSLPKDVEMWHEGFCGHCGKRLTVPESILSGFGKLCDSKRHKLATEQLQGTLFSTPK